METVEIIIFFMFTIILGSLLIAFIVGFDVGGIYSSIKGAVSPDEEPKFEKIGLDEFPKKLFLFRNSCENTDQNRTVTYYLEGNGTLKKSDIFDIVKALNWCNNIQSQEHGCGTREDIMMPPNITLPDLVTINCEQGKGLRIT
jgi:hypothetical protein